MTASDLKHLFTSYRKTMKFFGSKLHNVYDGPNGVYFVTSEKPPHSGRRYTVRHWDGEHVRTVGEAHSIVWKDDATAEAEKLAGRRYKSQGEVFAEMFEGEV